VADATTPISNPSRFSRLAWIAVPLLALVFAAWTTLIRAHRVEYVSHVAGAPASGPWQPRLVVPGHSNESYEWLDLTRQMLGRRELRVRTVDYENALSGREVFASSPYRWWLGLVALTYHGVTRAHSGPSLEWAGVYADPILLLFFGAVTITFVARRFGALAAALASAALALLFPFAAEFAPGIPDDLGLAGALALWSVLALLAGASEADASATRRWFALGGVLGGVGLWINVARELTFLAGIGAGALLAAWVSRRGPAAERRPLPWRAWGLAGAATCLAAYVVEFFPSHMGNWEFHAIHPIFGMAWIGGAELVAMAAAWIGGGRPKASVRGVATVVLAAAALVSLPAAMAIVHSLGFLSMDLPTMRLSLLPDGPSAPTLWAWLLQNGFTAAAWATGLPLLLVVPALLLLWPRMAGAARRVPIALALGPVLVATGFAFRQISWWNGVDASLLALLVAMAAGLRGSPRPRLVAAIAAALAAVVLLPGAVQLWPSTEARLAEGLSEAEVVGLVERDMAYWLASHVGSAQAVVVAPPNQTTTLYYYGGIRGLATLGWEDRDGFQSAVRIMSATTPEEAQELIGLHGVTHLVIPSWDGFMDAYARIGSGQIGGTFLDRLHQWNLPRWLKPVPYLVPTIAGFEGQSAVVLEVVDEQDDATALSRIAEYFVDMGQLELATKAAGGLRRFPADLGALLARAQVQTATSENDEFAKTVDLIIRRISAGGDGDLQWDQRVGLAIVLAQAHHVELARTQLKECLGEIDAEKLRSLSTTLLYRFQVLSKALNLGIADPSLKVLSLDLLPPDLQSRVE
jgi:hypothetical protein